MGPRFREDDAEGLATFAAQANACSRRSLPQKIRRPRSKTSTASNPEKPGEFVTVCTLFSAGEVG